MDLLKLMPQYLRLFVRPLSALRMCSFGKLSNISADYPTLEGLNLGKW